MSTPKDFATRLTTAIIPAVITECMYYARDYAPPAGGYADFHDLTDDQVADKIKEYTVEELNVSSSNDESDDDTPMEFLSRPRQLRANIRAICEDMREAISQEIEAVKLEIRMEMFMELESLRASLEKAPAPAHTFGAQSGGLAAVTAPKATILDFGPNVDNRKTGEELLANNALFALVTNNLATKKKAQFHGDITTKGFITLDSDDEFSQGAWDRNPCDNFNPNEFSQGSWDLDPADNFDTPTDDFDMPANDTEQINDNGWDALVAAKYSGRPILVPKTIVDADSFLARKSTECKEWRGF